MFDRDMAVELHTTQTKADKEAFANGTAKFISGVSKYGKYKKNVSWDFESPWRWRIPGTKISLV